MKKLFVPLLIVCFALCGCTNKQGNTSSSFDGPYYKEVEDLHIGWDDLFNQKENQYYAYVYSVTCTPCSMLREEVIEFARSGKVPFYFVNPNDDIPFVNDAETADASLGATSLENVYCLSTPTLIGITDKTVTTYSRDYYQIKGFIESYNE